jgi:cytochrome c-type biogenesis protein CcmE
MPTFTPDDLRQSLAPLLAGPVRAEIVIAWAAVGVVTAAWMVRCRPRWRRRLRIAVSLLAVAGAAGVSWWSQQDHEVVPLKFVDEVAGNVDTWRGKRLHVHGCVSRVFEDGARPGRYLFEVESIGSRPTAAIEARYTGLLPDPFRVGAEVVLTGSLAPTGALDVEPDRVMTSCRTRYDPHGISPSCRRDR